MDNPKYQRIRIILDLIKEVYIEKSNKEIAVAEETVEKLIGNMT